MIIAFSRPSWREKVPEGRMRDNGRQRHQFYFQLTCHTLSVQ
jgi:hypothetical protein